MLHDLKFLENRAKEPFKVVKTFDRGQIGVLEDAIVSIHFSKTSGIQ